MQVKVTISVLDWSTIKQPFGFWPFGAKLQEIQLGKKTKMDLAQKHRRKAYLPTLTAKSLGLSKYLKTGLV